MNDRRHWQIPHGFSHPFLSLLPVALIMPEPSLASSSTSPPSFVLQERDGRKLSLERALIEPSTGLNQQVLDSEQPQARKSIAKNLAARYSRRFALQYPKAYSWTKRAILYVRGPQPKEDLLRTSLFSGTVAPTPC